MKKMFGKKMILAALIAGLFAGAPLMAQAQGHGPARMYQKGPAMHKAPMKEFNRPMKEFNRPMKHFNPPPRAMHKGPGPVYMMAPAVVYAQPVVMVPAPPPPPPPPPPYGHEWRMVNGNRVLVDLGGIMIRLAW